MITLDGLTGITTPGETVSGTGVWSVGGTQLYKDSSGNLGLGVTPKTSGVSGYIELMADKYITSQGDGNTFASNSYYSSGWKYSASALATRYTQYGGQHQWHTAPSGTAGNAISFTQAMTLDASGNLGIGTSSPSTYGQLSLYRASGDVEAAVVTGGANYATYRIQNSTNRYSMQIRTDVSNAWVLRDETNSANRLVVDTSGNLLVGTTALYGTGGISLDATGFEGTGQIRFNRTARATISYPMDFRNGGTAVGYISYTNTATTYTTSSDLRLKTNIAPAGSAIQSILDFPVDQFDWISTGEHQDFGAVAQKAIDVIPEMVSVPADPDEMWGIDWSKAVPRLIKTIQELTAELNELKQKVNA